MLSMIERERVKQSITQTAKLLHSNKTAKINYISLMLIYYSIGVIIHIRK